MTTFPEPALTLSLKLRTRFAPTATLVELSAGVVPDRVGGVVSVGGTRITSSLAKACHDVPRFVPTGLAVTTEVPFISHTVAGPLSFCHGMSDLPSPLKSPEPSMCQSLPGLVPTVPLLRTAVPFISQTMAWPLSFCHRMSDLPSPLKSPALSACQDVPRLEPTLVLLRRVVPFISQTAA